MRFARPTQIKSSEGVSHSSLLFTLSCCSGGRAFGPPLCGGTPPATPPDKNTPRRRRGQLERLRPATGAWTPAQHLPPIHYPPVSVTEREKARKTPFAPPRNPCVGHPLWVPYPCAPPRGLDSADATSTLFLLPCIGESVSLQICLKYLLLLVGNSLATHPTNVAYLSVFNKRQRAPKTKN